MSLKVADVDTDRKPACDILPVNNTYTYTGFLVQLVELSS